MVGSADAIRNWARPGTKSSDILFTFQLAKYTDVAYSLPSSNSGTAIQLFCAHQPCWSAVYASTIMCPFESAGDTRRLSKRSIKRRILRSDIVSGVQCEHPYEYALDDPRALSTAFSEVYILPALKEKLGTIARRLSCRIHRVAHQLHP